jgi:hypothetical protein
MIDAISKTNKRKQILTRQLRHKPITPAGHLLALIQNTKVLLHNKISILFWYGSLKILFFRGIMAIKAHLC